MSLNDHCSILSNKRVICKLIITPTHKMAASMWSKMAAPMWTQDGHHKMASREGQLGGTGPAWEGGWEGPGLQGRAIRVDQACREGQLGRETQACRGEQLGRDQVCRGGKLGANRLAGSS